MVNTTTAARTALTAALLTLAACSSHHTNTGATPTTTQISTAAPRTSPNQQPPASVRISSNPDLTSTTPDPSNATLPAPATVSTNPQTARDPVQAYLAIAHAAYPYASNTTLISQGRHICTQLTNGHSLNDLTGDLAAKLGNQAFAHQLITAASAAYCPRTSP